jgi:2-hydroxychromene-2-carboxylate isomerase
LLGVMGDLIRLRDWRADRSSSRPAFFFDLSCPFSYLAAERVERVLGEVDWVPAAAAAMNAPVSSAQALEHDPLVQASIVMARAEREALELGLPLVWPDRFPADCPASLRVAAYAAEVGAGGRFALAASRLAFCGGYDLDERDVLAEAAAAAGLPVDACLTAAGDAGHDLPLRVTGQGLTARGVPTLPAVSVDRHWLCGERMLERAVPLLGAAKARRRPLAG